MKFTLPWLADHLETTTPLSELTAMLDRIGLEVESVRVPDGRLNGFVVARVLETEKHPNADKLRLCKVDYGQVAKGGMPLQVVCGAPNARAGMIAVFAPEGAFIPGTGITLTNKNIRGVESSGMLCSERELMLSEEHDGIIDLGDEFAVFLGQDYITAAGLDVPMLEVKITANRPDATAVRGIARDLAAAGLGALKPAVAGYTGKGVFPHPVPIVLDFPDGLTNACPAFASRVIRNVRNGPSPAWLQQRLRAIGLKPRSALVDITNFLTFDRARPLHVYDADKLKGTLRVRLGRAGERFAALDGHSYAVTPDMTVIADDAQVLGLGGIMGGTSSGCSTETTTVLIESAWFDPVRTATTGRAAGINSDARYRFERGVDPESLQLGVELATAMILEMCGGEPSTFVMAGTPPQGRREIVFRPQRVASLAGLDVPASDSTRILKALGFDIVAPKGKGETLHVTTPSNRPDVHGEADLVEEVIRIIGIDKIQPAALPTTAGVARATLTEAQKRVRLARRMLAGRGLIEAVTWSFITHENAQAFGGGADELQLANPISSELSDMRPSLLPGLLLAAGRNLDRSLGDHGLFEIGQIYRGCTPADQRMAAAAVRTGADCRHWSGANKPADPFLAKADMATVLALAGLDINRLLVSRDAPGWFHPGRSGAVKLGPKIVLGHFGVLHPRVLQQLGLPAGVVGFELDLDALPAAKKKATRARGPLELADLQPVRRDFAFVVNRDVAAAELVRAAEGADKSLITSVTLFDVFEGGTLGEGRKSLAIEVTLQPRDKTLTDSEIEAVSERIVAQVKKATGGAIRG